MTLPRRGGAAVAFWLSVALGGCASLESLRADLTGEPVPAKAADPDVEPAAEPQPDVYTLEVVAPDPLRALLAQHLDLARFRDARVAGAVTPLELDRLIAGTPAQARTLAETEGYFDAEVAVERTKAEVPHVVVTVVPGPQARIEDFGIAIEGPLLEAERGGDARATDTAAMVVEQWPLPRGAPFTQPAWTSAKTDTLVRLQGAGYPLARWRSTSATVDPATHRVKLHLVAESGPLFRIGALRIEGLSRYDLSVVYNLLDFEPGVIYTESLLAQWQRHLQKSELFEAAVVTLEVDAAQADAATVLVALREMPLQQVTTGIGYSSDTGPRITLDYTHRRLFGADVTATSKLELGGAKYSWVGQLISHPLPDNYRNLVSADAERLDLDDELRTSASVRVGRTQDTDDHGRQYYVALQTATVESALPTSWARAASLNYNWVRRDIDSITLPTRGTVFAAQTAGGYAFHTSASDGPFARALGAIVGYQPLGSNWHLQWRVEAGQVFASSRTGIPDTLLFRAGGQDSVRGYGYRTLGPKIDGVVTSGRMLFTSSVEVAHPISSRLPSVWGALFVDAGNASNSWGEMRPVIGAGPGIRWRSPVGALRADLAYGFDNRSLRLEISLGIAP